MFLQYLIDSLVLGSIYALMAIGFTLIFGIMNIVNLAHGELFVFGAFTAITLTTAGVNYFLAIMLAMVVTAVLGFLLQKGIFERLGKDEVRTMLASIGLSIFLQSLALKIFGPEYHVITVSTGTIKLGSISITYQRLGIVLIAVVLVIVLNLLVRYTWFGRAMRAVAQYPEMASVMGVNSRSIYALTFMLSAALAGAAGALLAGLFSVSATSGFIPATKAFIITIFGGVGSVPGAIVGAFVLGFAENLTAGYVSQAFSSLVAFVLLVVVLLVRPNGIFGRRTG